jgi:DNA replication factor GINS
MASLAAADMPTEDEGLTEEERKLFETLVSAIEQNRDHVFAILDGESPSGTPVSPSDAARTGSPDQTSAHDPGDSPESHPDPGEFAADEGDTGKDPGRAPPPDEPVGAEVRDDAVEPAEDTRVDAADLMSGDGPTSTDGSDTAGDPSPPPDEPPEVPDEGPPAAASGGDAETRADSASPGSDGPPTRNDGGTAVRDPTRADGHSSESGDDSDPAADEMVVDRSTVKITADVGEIFGVDERAYDLTEDDVVTLPEPNAGPLVDRDAAERLD